VVERLEVRTRANHLRHFGTGPSCSPAPRHFCKAFDHTFDLLLSGLRRARRSSRSMMIRHVEGAERSSSAAAAGRNWQGARHIWRKPLFVRLRRRFERDFDHVTDTSRLAGRSTLICKTSRRFAPPAGVQLAERSFAAIASEHWMRVALPSAFTIGGGTITQRRIPIFRCE
jgi:hypothetical protein